MKRWKFVILLVMSMIGIARAQAPAPAFDDATRALYILDISKYVKYNDSNFASLPEFTITVLSDETKFYWELANAAKSRQTIQQKPIKVLHSRSIESIAKSQVVYVRDVEQFKVNDVLQKIKGNHTLLVTENCEFRLSMINFIAVDGKPKFEANEKLMNEEGLTVSQLFLAQAVKTREEWEQLFTKTDIELGKEKETVKQQNVVIDNQKSEIARQASEIERQKAQLLKLDEEINRKQQILAVNIVRLHKQELNIANQSATITKQKAEVEQQKQVLTNQIQQIEQQRITIKESEQQIEDQKLVLAQKLKLIEKQQIVMGFSFVLLLVFALLGYFIYRSYQIKRRANIALEEKNRTITAQKDEIERQRDLAEMQRDQIAYQKRHIMDSIHYAKRIQSAVLPSVELFTDKLEHFVLYKPKDIVSGDFYWQTKIDNQLILVVADCTGHGVPGAFMSMLGVSLLNEIVNNQHVTRPDLIINILRQNIINSLRQNEHPDIKDGMDITVCNVNFNLNMLQYSGANNSLYFVRNGELTEIKADKMPVAIHEVMRPFNVHEMPLQAGDIFYAYSDGFADQFGGPDNKKYMTRNFKCALTAIHQLPMLQQGDRLNEIFELWRGENEQLDDVTVVGVRY